jgi:hypothetical protein
MRLRKKPSLSWSIPFVIHKQQMIEEIKTTFSPKFFIRVIAVFTAIFFPIRYALLQWLPELEADWFFLYWVSILSQALFLFIGCLGMFNPPRVIIDRHGIRLCSGQRVVFHRFEDIASLRIIENAKPFPLLRIEFLTQQDAKEYPVAPTVSLAHLGSLLDDLRYRTGQL